MARFTERSRTSGVFPTRALSESYTCMARPFQVQRQFEYSGGNLTLRRPVPCPKQ
jgi:hypothetical protein